MESSDDVLRLKLARACTVARQLARVTKMLLHQLDAQEEKKEVRNFCPMSIFVSLSSAVPVC